MMEVFPDPPLTDTCICGRDVSPRNSTSCWDFGGGIQEEEDEGEGGVGRRVLLLV